MICPAEMRINRLAWCNRILIKVIGKGFDVMLFMRAGCAEVIVGIKWIVAVSSTRHQRALWKQLLRVLVVSLSKIFMSKILNPVAEKVVVMIQQQPDVNGAVGMSTNFREEM